MRDGFGDEWLGALHHFPTILHARASLSFDLSPDSFQKALVSALSSLRALTLPRVFTVAGEDGDSGGRVGVRLGGGDGVAVEVVAAKRVGWCVGVVDIGGALGAR